MKNAPTRRTSRLLLLLPPIAALAVRLIGLRHGAPTYVFHPDVAKQSRVAMSVYDDTLDLRALFQDNLHFTMYPYGTAVALGHALRAWTAVTGDERPATVHRWNWAYWLRLQATALFTLALALLLPALARAIGLGPALAAGFLLAFEPVSAYYSHYGMNDVPLLALLLLAWWCAGNIPGERRLPVWSLTTGLLLGAGFGVKYQALLGGVFPLFGCAALLRTAGWKRAAPTAVCVAAGLLLGALATTPLLVADPRYFAANFLPFMAWQTDITGAGLSRAAKLAANLPTAAGLLLGGGRWLLLPAFAWGAYALCTSGRRDAATGVRAGSALAFCALLGTAVLTSRDLVRDNDLMPVTAFAALLYGMMLADVNRGARGRRWRPVAWTSCAAAVCAFAWTSAADSLALARPDTRVRARDWCRANLPAGSVVLRERYTLPVGRDDLDEIVDRVLSSRRLRKRILRDAFDFAIASDLAHARFFDARSPYHDETAQVVYRRLHAQAATVAEFRDRSLPFAHPTVTVYACKP